MLESLFAATVTRCLWDVTTTVAGGVAGNRADALVHGNWKRLVENLKLYRPAANHDLQRAVSRAYLQATLQVCALRGESLPDFAAWLRDELLPGPLSKSVHMVRSRPSPSIILSETEWLKLVSRDLITQIRELDQKQSAPPPQTDQPGLEELIGQYELLLQPEGAEQRVAEMRQSLLERVIADIEQKRGAASAPFKDLLRAHWFNLLCACFQYSLKRDQQVANIFMSQLLAGLSVSRPDGQAEPLTLSHAQAELEKLGGDLVQRLDETYRLIETQGEHLGRIEQDVLLPVRRTAKTDPVVVLRRE